MAERQSNGQGNVALYWDFENVHFALGLREAGGGAPAGRLVDLDAVVAFASTFGCIVIHRAYANWHTLSRYRSALLDHSVDLVQLFSRGPHGKNGADIRLALDVLDDIHHFQHLTHAVIVSGDSDFVAVAQKVRQTGRTVVGLGVEGATNAYWVKACDAFEFIEGVREAPVTGPSPGPIQTPAPPPAPPPELAAGRALLVRAVRALSAARGEPHVVKAAVRPMMQALDPTFDLGRLGFASFTKFLEACRDTVRVVVGPSDHMVSLVAPEAPEADLVAANAAQPLNSTRDRYLRALAAQEFRLDEPEWSGAAIIELCGLFGDTPDGFESLDAVEAALAARLAVAGQPAEPSRIRQFRNVLYSAVMFRFGEQRRVFLRCEPVPEAVTAAIERTVVERLRASEDDAIDAVAVCELLYGDPAVRLDAVTAVTGGTVAP